MGIFNYSFFDYFFMVLFMAATIFLANKYPNINYPRITVVFAVLLFSSEAILFCKICFFGNQIFLPLLAFSVTYVSLCVLFKKKMKAISYAISFYSITIYFIIYITTTFGMYYTLNDLVSYSEYSSQFNGITNFADFSIISFIECYLSFFNLGLKYYFVLPTNVSLSNPFFVQFVVGIVIGGTSISCVFDTIKRLIAISNSSDAGTSQH